MGVRFRFRAPNDNDRVQLKHAVETYVRHKSYDASALSSLVEAFNAVPPGAQRLFADVAILAEAYVILHEVGHELPFPGVAAMTLGELPMNPTRRAAWEDELRADVSACELLLFGLMSAAHRRQPQESPSVNDAQSAAAQALRAEVFEQIACAVAGVHSAIWLAASAVEPSSGASGMPARTDPRFRTHPPLQIRTLAFDSWLARRTAENGHAEFAYAVGSRWPMALCPRKRRA